MRAAAAALALTASLAAACGHSRGRAEAPILLCVFPWPLQGPWVEHLRAHRLLIVPGGNFVEMGNQLKPATSATIRRAVQEGLNYHGLCGGAFLAGNSPYNGLNLTGGVRFGFYSASRSGVRKAAVPVSTPGAPTLDQYWEDGPELSGWGAVVARYPDGTPAVAQGWSGKGWVVLSGVHAEASESWRRGLTFTTPAHVDNAYAATLVDAALKRTPLPEY